MNHRSATVKVGLLTIISLFVLITTVIWLRGRGLGGGHSFEVYFRDVDGLRDGAPVQFMGIRVGFVDEVNPMLSKDNRYRVKVRFTVTEPSVNVPRGSYISLEQSGIIGEKFMEITPPRPEEFELMLHKKEPVLLRKDLPIKVAFKEGLVKVGHVIDSRETVVPQLIRKTPDYKYQLRYMIRKPGYFPPDHPSFQLVQPKNGDAYLMLEDKETLWVHQPTGKDYFTLEEPLRLKEFLAQQLASAEALKTTNDRINKLLSDEAIDTIQDTLRNSEELTAKAADAMEQANHLFATTSKDLGVLVSSTQELTNSVVSVSNNINELAGNPELKANIEKTIHSVEQSTTALSALLNDPNLKLILSDARLTSQNAAEVMQYMKQTTIDNNLQGRINDSLTLLNGSLTKLSGVMENLETISDDKDTIRSIIQDTEETSKNLNKFSDKLNKRFLLFRLLF